METQVLVSEAAARKVAAPVKERNFVWESHMDLLLAPEREVV